MAQPVTTSGPKHTGHPQREPTKMFGVLVVHDKAAILAVESSFDFLHQVSNDLFNSTLPSYRNRIRRARNVVRQRQSPPVRLDMQRVPFGAKELGIPLRA